MADRYQDRPFPADGRNSQGSAGGDDPLAELARLIGQTDPRSAMGRANQSVKPRSAGAPPRDELPQAPPAQGAAAASGPLPWMQRTNRPDVPPQDFPNAAHPLQRQAPPPVAPEPDLRQAPPLAEQSAEEADPSRYDEALYGQFGGDMQDSDLDQGFADDGYGYQDGYDDEIDEQPRKRRGLVTVAAVLALALVGTGGALAYRTFFGASRSGEPPIIRADAGPTKIMPANSDGVAKVPDRLSPGDGTERIVPREEAPVDVDAQSGPRVVLPGLGPQNSGLPPISSSASASPPPSTTPSPVNGAGNLANNEPRRVKILSIHGDQPDPTAMAQAVPAPAAGGKPAPVVRSIAPPRSSASAANANASAPLSLVPQTSEPTAEAPPRARVAAASPVQAAPAAGGSGGGYLVQVASQRNEADAQASYKVLQGKFPTMLGSRSPLIKRADLGDKGIYYRAMVGPFESPDEATQFCGSLKTAGGQCVVQRN